MKKLFMLIFFCGMLLVLSKTGTAALTDQQPDELKIGNQIWARRNLSIPIVNSFWYERDSIANKTDGRLYYFSAAQSVCPKGWHIPSDEEWEQLFNFLGGDSSAVSKLLPGGSSGLNITLAGYRSANSSNDLFGKKGDSGMYWTSTVKGEQTAYGKMFTSTSVTTNYYRRANSFSVRLIKD